MSRLTSVSSSRLIVHNSGDVFSPESLTQLAPIPDTAALIQDGPRAGTGSLGVYQWLSLCFPSLSLTPSLPHSLTPSLPHSLTPSLPHSLTPSLPHSLTPSLPHYLTPSLPHSLTTSLPHYLTTSLPLLHSLPLPLSRLITSPSLSPSFSLKS